MVDVTVLAGLKDVLKGDPCVPPFGYQTIKTTVPKELEFLGNPMLGEGKAAALMSPGRTPHNSVVVSDGQGYTLARTA